MWANTTTTLAVSRTRPGVPCCEADAGDSDPRQPPVSGQAFMFLTDFIALSCAAFNALLIVVTWRLRSGSRPGTS
jgi:hypothetical protein